MGYLQRLGLGAANYDKEPAVRISGWEDAIVTGWEAIAACLRDRIAGAASERFVIAVECYPGVDASAVGEALQARLGPALYLQSEEVAFQSAEAIDAMVEPELNSGERVFGRLTRLHLKDFLDPARVASVRSQIAKTPGLVLVIGPAASLVAEADLLVYADLPRWEAQLRQRRGESHNLGIENSDTSAADQYKRSFFIDWRAADKWKRETFEAWDFLLDTTTPDRPKLVTGAAFLDGLRQVATQPFRVVPFFDPGVWGGQWMREVCDLPSEAPNYAWCFDCVPEENSLVLDYGTCSVEVPAIDLVFFCPDALLGESVHGQFGAEFPIRFDFLDTMEGQNLSFQVHPLIDYAYEHFGLRYTQDESYYILDAGPDAEVYLGLKDGVDADAMLVALETAQCDPEQPFPAEDFVQTFPAKKHDHFLIPAGTCHCSGANSMVLEISHTPYIFTFKLWDWGRLGLDGQPRPIHLERGRDNIRWERTRSWVEPRLVNHVEPIAEGEGWREERTGLYESEVIETRRHWFSQAVTHDTELASVHVLNLVEGAEAIVESPANAFAPYVVHYAETFIIPAAVGRYTVRPHGPSEGKTCATLRASVRVHA